MKVLVITFEQGTGKEINRSEIIAPDIVPTPLELLIKTLAQKGVITSQEANDIKGGGLD